MSKSLPVIHCPPLNRSIPSLGLGCASLMSRIGKRESQKLLEAAFEAGIRFYDTSDFYGQGDSEALLGKMFHTQRNQVVITSKAGMAYSKNISWLKYLKAIARPLVRRFKALKQTAASFVSAPVSSTHLFYPEYITNALEASLKRLQTDYLDVYLLHNPPVEVIRQGDMFVLLQKLKQQGKIKTFGVSCGNAEEVQACLKGAKESRISFLQFPINFLEAPACFELAQQAQVLGIQVVARELFAHGDIFNWENSEWKIIQQKISAQAGLSSQEIILQYLKKKIPQAIFLIGVSQQKHLKENLQAWTSEKELSAEHLQLLSSVFRQ